MKIDPSDWGIAAFFLMIATLDNLTQRGLSTDENNQKILLAAIDMSENKGIQSLNSSLIRGADVLHAFWHLADKIMKNRTR